MKSGCDAEIRIYVADIYHKIQIYWTAIRPTILYIAEY
jgi:hypothetical protein